jgi:ubiquinone biosynthesis protein
MAFSLKPAHMKRYTEIIRLLVKYGSIDLVRGARLDQDLSGDEIPVGATITGDPEQLARDLEALGPTFIKLGQLLSTRPDLLPQPYLDALARLQDTIEPFPYDMVEEIVSQELGVRLSKAFQDFATEPLAAASLGQVHQARLRDGRAVAVKIQRPGIRQVILDDFEVLETIAAAIDQHTDIGQRYAFQDMLAAFRHALVRELDYRQEAQNLMTLGDHLRTYAHISVPQPVMDYTTSRVLTMDYIRGTKVTALSPLAQLETDGQTLAEELCKAYLDQILVEGFFHADPHPGNLLLTDDHTLVLLDLGMAARIDPSAQESLLKLVLAISSGRGREVAALLLAMGTRLHDYDDARFTREVIEYIAHYQDATVEHKGGRIVMELARIAAANGLRPAPELTILGKTLLTLDEIGRSLDPSFDPQVVVRHHADALLRQHLLKSLAPSNVFASMLEMHEFLRQLPTRLNLLLDALTRKEFELKIQALDEPRLMANLLTVANRVTLGLVLAALIVGAALMMRIETSFTLFGYPGIAMIFFLLAAAGGFAQIISIFLHDK